MSIAQERPSTTQIYPTMTTRNIHLNPIAGPSVWHSADWKNDDSWITRLTSENITDINLALRQSKSHHRSFATITEKDFPLPSMRQMLEKVRADVLNGRGFSLVRGLQVSDYSIEDCERIFWGIGTHIGMGVTQNANADLIAHVFDRRYDYTQRTVRAYQVKDALAMHCDNSDLVGLFCVRAAMSGGASLLTSSLAAFNEILRTRPEYLGILFSGFAYDRKGEQGIGEAPFTQKVPTFSVSQGGVMSCRYSRSYLHHAQETVGLKLSPLEIEVLDYFESITGNPQFQMEMHLEAGDMLFCNNYTVLHARRGFEDFPEPERSRLLLRLWLEVDNVREIDNQLVRHGFHHYGNLGKRATEWLRMQEDSSDA